MQFNFTGMCKSIIMLDEAANESYPAYTIEQACENLRSE